MTKRYHVVSTPDSPSTLDSKALADFFAKDGHLLLPMLDLIGNAQGVIDSTGPSGKARSTDTRPGFNPI